MGGSGVGLAWPLRRQRLEGSFLSRWELEQGTRAISILSVVWSPGEEVPELKLFGKGHPLYFQCSPGGALEMKSKTVVYVVNASRTPSRLELA